MFLKYIQERLKKGRVKYKVSDEDENTLFELTNTHMGLLANYTIVFFILLSIAIVWLASIPGFGQKYLIYIFIGDFVISTVFLFEYIYRWRHSSKKRQFPFRIMNILDLLSFFPFFVLIILFGMGHYTIFALFRIFRIFRIFELIQRLPVITKLLIGLSKHRVEYFAAIFVIFIILTVFSTLVYLVEQQWGNTSTFTSIPQTFWWAVVTMTTTGYGEIVPSSFLGKTIASILMFLGPLLIAILSSITVIVFLDSTKMIQFNKKEYVCNKCGVLNDNEARYCDHCGKKLEK